MNVHNWNQHDLNRLCGKLLRQQKQPRSEMNVQALSLAIWGLENPDLEFEGPWSRYRSSLLEQANQMLSWNPDRVMQMLGQDPDDKDLNGQAKAVLQQMKNLEAEEAAAILSENLYENLRQTAPAFR